MFRFLIGLVVGVLVGVLVVAPNPELSARVQEAWNDGRRWVVAFVSTVGEKADEAADEAVQGAGEAMEDVGEAVQR